MNEEHLQEIRRTLEAGEVPSDDDITFLFDTIAQYQKERDYAQGALIKSKQEQQAAQLVFRNFLGI